jgi:protein O-GlcNAc transferase
MRGSKASSSTFQRAVRALEAGRDAEAARLFSEVLERNPRHVDALDGLSTLECQAGRLQRAAELLGRLVGLAPREARFQLNLGEVLRRLGQPAEALARTQRALELNQNYAEAWFNKGTLLAQAGELSLAVPCLERATDLLPESPALQLGLADVLAQRGEEERAQLHRLCASLLQGKGDASAEALFQRALAHRQAGERSLALACYHVLAALDPSALGTWLAACDVLRSMARVEGAVAAARRCVQVAPRDARAHAAAAATKADAGHFAAAEACARRAVALDERDPEAHFQLGRIHFELGDCEGALASYRKLLELAPDHRGAHSNLIFLMPYVADSSAAATAAEARRWAARHAAPLATESPAHGNDRSPDRPLRIGYVSGDFCQHPMANYFLPLLAHHRRHAFRVHCYASVREPDQITRQIAASSDVFREVAGLSDAALADVIRADQIDVLVDLALHSGDHRLLTFARRPAPVQICYLGYLGTTGLDGMQYRLTSGDLDDDRPADPECYTEAPLELGAYWCYRPLLASDDPGLMPNSATGGQRRIVFGSLNSLHKVSREALSLWAEVLRAVEDSVFVMAAPEQARSRLVKAFASLGVPSSRVTILPYQSRRDYMRAYRGIDLCLDTTPCNGATTHLDGLWMGTPTLTLVGRAPGSRAGLHICQRMELPQMITRTREQFVARALELTRDLDQLGVLRSNLRARLEASSLMNGPQFIADLESAYRKAWSAWCQAAE